MKKLIVLLAAFIVLLSTVVIKGATEEAEAPIEIVELPAETEFQIIHTTQTPTTEAPKSERWTDEEKYILEKIAMAEAEGEDTKGKALVMMVVLNRVVADEFPDNIKDVVMQDKQFSPVSNGRYDAVEPDADCEKALQMVDDGWDEAQDALYFESSSSSRWHQENLTFLYKHGNHYFYK